VNRSQPAGKRWPYWIATGTVILGLLVTAVLTLLSHVLYTRNEKRLLELRAREVASVIATSLPAVQTTFASAAAFADATHGDPRQFRRFIAPYVGPMRAQQFRSMSLWRLHAQDAPPLVTLGSPPMLTPGAPEARAFFAHSATSPKLSIIGLRHGAVLAGIGYAFNTPGTGRYLVYGERTIPSDRQSRFRTDQAFSELNYAFYLGRSTNTTDLLVTSVRDPPLRGATQRLVVPFGDAVLTLVVGPRQSLAGSLPERLPWIIAIGGVILTLGVGWLVARLTRRRQAAEHLADELETAVAENQRLYAEQRTIAQTLQHALLPAELPPLDGAEASARYAPGEHGIDIGGDWYDVIPQSDRELLVVVGDVSGRGLEAGTTMAALRYAIHAYAAQHDAPEEILRKLSRILSVSDGGQLATVLCALIDIKAHTIRLASAGHLPPLLLNGRDAVYLDTKVGVPIGVESDVSYTARTTTAPPRATFLAFTDGLVERRGERLDEGLARLRDAATAEPGDLHKLLDRLLDELRSGSQTDDTAIVGLRWNG
jgi:serine phosphatase RsbU (regulator of sigma subunit)